MPQINLAPGTQYIVAAKRRRTMVYMASLVIIAAVLIAWGVVVIVEKTYENKLAAVKSDTVNVDTEIARLSTDVERVQSFEERLSALNGLLKSQVSWGVFLQNLEQYLPPQVILSELAIVDGGKQLEMQFSAPTLDDAAQAVASLRNRPGRNTLFPVVNISSAEIRQDKDEAGQVIATRYVFSLEALINNTEGQQK